MPVTLLTTLQEVLSNLHTNSGRKLRQREFKQSAQHLVIKLILKLTYLRNRKSVLLNAACFFFNSSLVPTGRTALGYGK